MIVTKHPGGLIMNSATQIRTVRVIRLSLFAGIVFLTASRTN